jgi:peptidoglycan/LPS O-acetylase OafA/YrhL
MGNEVGHDAAGAQSRGLYRRIIERFSRVTSSGRYIPELDGMRFIAISLVFLQHTQSAVITSSVDPGSLHRDLFSSFVSRMRIGVELFFVISGFILGLPFAAHALGGERSVPLRAYYLRRVARLEPPYVLTMVLFYLLLVIYRGADAGALFPHFLASVFYVHNVAYWDFSSINGVAWSLEVEVQFYILAPLFARLFCIRSRWRRRTALITVSVVCFIVSRGVYRLLGAEPPLTILSYLSYFMAGFLLADLYVSERWEDAGSDLAWDAVAVTSWLVLLLSVLTEVPARPLATTALLFTFCYGVFRGRLVRQLLAAAPIRTIGGMCYSIYLMHNHLLYIFADFWVPGTMSPRLSLSAIAATAIYGIPVLVVSALFFILVEKPCMQRHWPENLWAKLTAVYRSVFVQPAPATQK